MSISIEASYPAALHQEMASYNEVLELAIQTKSGEPIPNSDENHGALLMTKLFEQTRDRFAMVVGSFNGSISNKKNYIEALTNCLEIKKAKARVLIIDNPNENSQAYQIISKNRIEREGEVEIKFATKETVNLIKDSFEGNRVLHFAVFDDDKYRLEISPEDYQAIGSFCNKERANDLLTIFDKAFNTARSN